MAANEVLVQEREATRKTGPATPQKRPPKRSGWGRFILIALLLGFVGGSGFYWFVWAQEHGKKAENRESSIPAGSKERGAELKVKVVQPRRGGMQRITDQPGTIRAFDFAPLYAKVSGFVLKLHVDRGSRVHEGEVLLEIYDPEKHVAVLQAQAELDKATAAKKQAEARVKVAEANVVAAVANEVVAHAKRDEMVAQRDYRKKQYERISALAQRDAIEQRLVDEQYDQWHAAEASVLSAEAGIKSAAAETAEAKAEVEKAQADVKAMTAEIEVRKANIDMAKVFVEYTKIISPYDGVVTSRGQAVHRGAFVRSAAEGAGEPLLTVARTDKMRTIVLVPDPDVPYCKVGDPATIRIDALAGQEFHATVSRTAESEDLADRNMRVEIDLDNPEGVLKDGQYGRAVILLEKAVKNLTIPSQCLLERNGRGEGAVQVVRNGEVHRVNVHVGMDNGLRVEVPTGLSEGDQVILQPDASMADGTKVQVEQAKEEEGQPTPAAA
jgi:RND family efflux transporter MFP subunit